ncbi:polysaccharide deacetylase [Clostridium swellfunianum]|uniref:polysaccharide deacetylase family protein n=1 Tax=Clostridium swellfunianum TaxID=1367462 RepID=UPI00203029CD|nr:polysaccharide deacetylase family protein [Clostridium swellfunianum]MCM0649730.1 polysaccharide deacetylase [Clostridium swellfunianum]
MKRNTRLIVFGIFTFIMASACFVAWNVARADSDQEEEKVVYLTFDDGPSYIITNRVLDILKEKEVKATFFVVGNKIEGREDILKRIHEDGHSLGLHTYSHKYKEIYSSHDNFVKEMEDAGEAVKKVIGFEPKPIRFPGGSKPYLNSSLLEKLHERGYKVFDWNASLSDGLNYNISTERLVKEAHKVVGGSNSKVYLLLHCDQTNKATAKALPMIIDYYKNLGYEFKTITEDTPEYYFRFKKS